MTSPVQIALPLQLLLQMRVPAPRPNYSIYDPSVQIQPATLPPGYVPHPEIGVAYKVYGHKVSWKVARKQCNLEGADLALIDSYTKLDYVLRQNHTHDFTHVGILRMYDDTEWIGVGTGLPVSPIPWAVHEPSGITDCVMINNSVKGLTNHGCFTMGNYVCELPILGNFNATENMATTETTNKTSDDHQLDWQKFI